MHSRQPSRMTTHIQTALLAVVLSGTLIAHAEERGTNSRQERRGPPPPEAFEACANAQEGDSCEVQTRRGDVLTGQCVAARGKPAAPDETDAAHATQSATGDLVCRPDHHPHQQSELR